MKISKLNFLFLAIAAFSLAMASSCKKKDKNKKDDIAIVGTWNATLLHLTVTANGETEPFMDNDFSEADEYVKITFTKDGNVTLTQKMDDDVSSINGTYSVSGGKLTLTMSESDGVLSSGVFDYEITGNNMVMSNSTPLIVSGSTVPDDNGDDTILNIELHVTKE